MYAIAHTGAVAGVADDVSPSAAPATNSGAYVCVSMLVLMLVVVQAFVLACPLGSCAPGLDIQQLVIICSGSPSTSNYREGDFDTCIEVAQHNSSA